MNQPLPPRSRSRLVSRLRAWGVLRLSLLAALLGIGVWFLVAWLTYPSDRTPEGAYLRVMSAVNRGEPREFFAYLETPAQHACYTIRDFRKKSRARVVASYPEPERSRLAASFSAEADAPDGSDVFAAYAQKRGFLNRLRRDLSGIDKVERRGERATVQTARGTRYPFRIRPENGIWGLTLFTAELAAEAERAARDHALIERAAADYDRAASAAKN